MYHHHPQPTSTGTLRSDFIRINVSRRPGEDFVWFRGAQGFPMFPESEILQTLTFTLFPCLTVNFILHIIFSSNSI